MRATSWLLVVGCVAGCVAGFQGTLPGGGRDTGGRPDEADPCPGEDDADADGDGTPDACDPCPADPADDADADGLCADEDLCPDAEGDDCEVQLVLGLQVDFFYEEATWEMLDYRGSRVDGGGFPGPGAGSFRRITVDAGKATCVQVRDSERDGGNRGLVFNRRLGQRYAAWTFDQSRRSASVCFTPSKDGVAFEAPVEEDWIRDGACGVDLLVDVGSDPAEVAWGLRDPEDKLVQGVPYGTYAQPGAEARYSYVLAEGRYTLELFDEGGDGWVGGGWKLGKPGASGPFGEGTLTRGNERVFVEIRCGANP